MCECIPVQILPGTSQTCTAVHTNVYTLKGNNTAELVMNTLRNVLMVKLGGEEQHLKANQTFCKVYGMTVHNENNLAIELEDDI